MFIYVKEEGSMYIELMVRESHHQGVPHFRCVANNWEEANQKLTEGLYQIRKQNEQYIQNFESYHALKCGIIDFLVQEGKEIKKGQFSFDIDHINQSIEELVNWYTKTVH
jgi:hypothetical protein